MLTATALLATCAAAIPADQPADASGAAILRKVEQVEARREVLQALLAQGEARGQRLAYPRATNEVARRFTDYLRADVAEGRLEVSEWNADYLLDACERAIEEARRYLADPQSEPIVPEYDVLTARPRDGSFYAGKEPVFLFGSLCWRGVAGDIPHLPELGFRYVEQEMGPNSVVTGPGERSLDQIRYFEGVLDRAAQHNVTVDFLLSTHYFPSWAFEAYPETVLARHGGEGGFIKQCLEQPVSRQIAEEWLRAFIPRVKDKPALQSYILANEPLYVCYCDYSLSMFRQWLQARYDSVAVLNQAWDADFASWEGVEPPRRYDPPAVSRGAWYDWCRFNQERFTDYFVWMRGIIHQMDPGRPLHIKVMNHNIFDHTGLRLGIDREDLLLRAEHQISGCDMAMTPRRGDFTLSFHHGAMGYDFMRSVRPDWPVVDSEWHIIYGDPRLYPAPAGRASLWMSALHGMNGANVWVWERGQGAFDDGAILYHAELLETLARATLDLRRLMPEVTALQRASAPVALFFAQPSRFGSRHVEELTQAYTGALFAGRPVRFITERQLAQGLARRYDMIVVAGADYVTDESYRALEAFVRGGGTLLVTEGGLGRDERGRPLAGDLAASGRGGGVRLGRGRAVWAPAGMTGEQWFGRLVRLLELVSEPQPVGAYGIGGRPPWGVETRVVAAGGRHLVYALNLNHKPISVRLRARGADIARVTDLIAMRPADKTLRLEPNQVALLAVETAPR